MTEKQSGRLAKLADEIEKSAERHQKLLDEAAELTGKPGLKLVADSFRLSGGDWAAGRIRGLADPRPTLTDEGRKRREKALAEAKKAGDQARAQELEWQLGVLTGELPADTPRPGREPAPAPQQTTGEEG